MPSASGSSLGSGYQAMNESEALEEVCVVKEHVGVGVCMCVYACVCVFVCGVCVFVALARL